MFDSITSFFRSSLRARPGNDTIKERGVVSTTSVSWHESWPLVGEPCTDFAVAAAGINGDTSSSLIRGSRVLASSQNIRDAHSSLVFRAFLPFFSFRPLYESEEPVILFRSTKRKKFLRIWKIFLMVQKK